MKLYRRQIRTKFHASRAIYNPSLGSFIYESLTLLGTPARALVSFVIANSILFIIYNMFLITILNSNEKWVSYLVAPLLLLPFMYYFFIVLKNFEKICSIIIIISFLLYIFSPEQTLKRIRNDYLFLIGFRIEEKLDEELFKIPPREEYDPEQPEFEENFS
ncbi:MAG: hypothetical protein NTX65_12705 [Ignavibacteriales bacterium]|nr:hypothetical protein [Ignavibacteriales bacterium]